jgi:hypothetical protein
LDVVGGDGEVGGPFFAVRIDPSDSGNFSDVCAASVDALDPSTADNDDAAVDSSSSNCCCCSPPPPPPAVLGDERGSKMTALACGNVCRCTLAHYRTKTTTTAASAETLFGHGTTANCSVVSPLAMHPQCLQKV